VIDEAERFDVVVVGGGPAGQKAAVQAAKAGRSVLVVDRERSIGGECVYRGTIPSKTLRETALYLSGLRRRAGGLLDADLSDGVKVAALMQRLETVQGGHAEVLRLQMERNGVEVRRGRASFRSPHILAVQGVGRSESLVRGEHIVLAPGSRPRRPDTATVDHEHVMDSDSILSLIYLPRSLAILGGGVIACEFASIFAALGVEVTMCDGRDRPLGFLSPDLSAGFVAAFERMGGRYLAGRKVVRTAHDGVNAVLCELDDGTHLTSEKALCALGRVASVEGLNLEAAGLSLNDRGHLSADANGQTAVAHIYAAGDVAGPPALAASAMEQGRRAVCHALGLKQGSAVGQVPVGIYTIPEIATIGLSAAEVEKRHGAALVGLGLYSELARGQINGHTEGFIKLIADPDGRRLLGAEILGEGAAELIHVAQMAIIGAMDVDVFVEHVFNFPTLTEGYRVAALKIVQARPQAASEAA
jgi:NAD(P) transhydrogenase